MSILEFCRTNYEGVTGVVSWIGETAIDDVRFADLMGKGVADRLFDSEGREEFDSFIKSLPATGFTTESIETLFAEEVSEERAWAVGEALAEVYVGEKYGVVWPWNTERDKRTPSASLPGADLVGFELLANTARLALGEVKVSSDANAPPGVMTGRSGMINQLDNLATNLSVICQLLKWLLPRCKGTQYEESFRSATLLFLQSGNKAISLFGVLIRDTNPNQADVVNRGHELARHLTDPATCNLVAIYVPCRIADLPSLAKGDA